MVSATGGDGRLERWRVDAGMIQATAQRLHVWNVLKRLKRLDVKPAQVVIEARFVEISLGEVDVEEPCGVLLDVNHCLEVIEARPASGGNPAEYVLKITTR